MLVRLVDIAHARSGDKGDTANVGVIALKPGSSFNSRSRRDNSRASTRNRVMVQLPRRARGAAAVVR